MDEHTKEDRARRPITISDWPLKAKIHENEKDGRSWHSVEFVRVFRDAKGDWRESGNFLAADTLRVAKLAEQAHETVRRLREKERMSARDGQEQDERQAPAKRQRTRERDQDRER